MVSADTNLGDLSPIGFSRRGEGEKWSWEGDRDTDVAHGHRVYTKGQKACTDKPKAADDIQIYV
jgi:hypothetical protein